MVRIEIAPIGTRIMVQDQHAGIPNGIVGIRGQIGILVRVQWRTERGGRGMDTGIDHRCGIVNESGNDGMSQDMLEWTEIRSQALPRRREIALTTCTGEVFFSYLLCRGCDS